MLGIHQSNCEISGVEQVCPLIDLGMAVYTFENNVYHLVNFVPPRKTREIFLDLHLDKGTYYLLPLSIGFLRESEAGQQNLDEGRLLKIVASD